MTEKSLDKNDICLVFPRISKYSRFLAYFYKRSGKKVFYRGDFNEELISPIPSDLFYRASEAYGRFLHASIGSDAVRRMSRIFFLNPDVLAKAGKEVLYKKIQYDFYYAFQITKGRTSRRAQVIYPISKRDRKIFNDYLGAEPLSYIAGIFSTIGFLIERIKLFSATLVKTFYVGFRIIYWRLTKISKLAEEVKGNFIWIPAGSTEISLDSARMSLPLYLRQLSESGEVNNKKFAVVCPFLKKEQYWDDNTSFSIPSLRNLNPGLSNDLFGQGAKDLLKVLMNILIAFLKSSRDLDLLSLLPQLILNKIWLKSIDVKAVFMTESCAGCAYPVVHAAREIGVPAIMICYAANHRAVVLDKTNQDIVPVPFQNLLAEYFCVWTDMMKEWLISAGYEKEKIYVVGPQMFAPLDLKNELNENMSAKIKIGLFDVTPKNNEVYVKMGRGESIFNADYMLAFRQKAFGVMRKVFGNNFTVLLKIKRPVDARSKEWVSDWGEKVKDAFPEFDTHSEHRAPDSNPWMVLAEVDIVISMPFTSLSEASFAMGKPSAFFDPTKLIIPRPGGDEVPLLSGEEELYKWLSNTKQNRINLGSANCDNFGPKRVVGVLRDILFEV